MHQDPRSDEDLAEQRQNPDEVEGDAGSESAVEAPEESGAKVSAPPWDGWARPVGSSGHEVRLGECMHSLAEESGFFWETLWRHPENEELRRVRRDPNVLLPGDKVFIPEVRSRQEARASERRHRFRRKGVPARLTIQVLEDGQPVADEPYVLEVNGVQVRGRTGGQGEVSEAVPNTASRAVLIVRPGRTPLRYEIDLGSLPPHDSILGVQARLRNLGYAAQTTGELDYVTQRAVRAFQQDQGLDASGSVTEDTCTKLKEVHGS